MPFDPGKEQPLQPLRIRSTDWGCSVQNSKMKAYGPSNRSLGGVKPLEYSRRKQHFNIAYILIILCFVVGLCPYPLPFVVHTQPFDARLHAFNPTLSAITT